jgi:hypothetical protein
MPTLRRSGQSRNGPLEAACDDSRHDCRNIQDGSPDRTAHELSHLRWRERRKRRLRDRGDEHQASTQSRRLRIGSIPMSVDGSTTNANSTFHFPINALVLLVHLLGRDSIIP